MTRIGILLLLSLVLGCADKSNSGIQKAVIHTAEITKESTRDEELDTLKLDLNRSKLIWKGTKMRGTGSHEGEVRISHGFLLKDKNGLVGGQFELDIQSISITDIPKTDPIPINNLTEHLMHEDFFDVDNYPTAEFDITKITTQSSVNLIVSGNLTIRGITKNITFSAVKKGNSITTKFLLDRFEWNIAYEGSWADRTLVDRDIEFRIELVLAD
jgi:polyisoprenoid-binding protein YceI